MKFVSGVGTEVVSAKITGDAEFPVQYLLTRYGGRLTVFGAADGALFFESGEKLAGPLADDVALAVISYNRKTVATERGRRLSALGARLRGAK